MATIFQPQYRDPNAQFKQMMMQMAMIMGGKRKETKLAGQRRDDIRDLSQYGRNIGEFEQYQGDTQNELSGVLSAQPGEALPELANVMQGKMDPEQFNTPIPRRPQFPNLRTPGMQEMAGKLMLDRALPRQMTPYQKATLAQRNTMTPYQKARIEQMGKGTIPSYQFKEGKGGKLYAVNPKDPTAKPILVDIELPVDGMSLKDRLTHWGTAKDRAVKAMAAFTGRYFGTEKGIKRQDPKKWEKEAVKFDYADKQIEDLRQQMGMGSAEAEIPQPTTQAEYEAIPTGTAYIDTDGKRRTKN